MAALAEEMEANSKESRLPKQMTNKGCSQQSLPEVGIASEFGLILDQANTGVPVRVVLDGLDFAEPDM